MDDFLQQNIELQRFMIMYENSITATDYGSLNMQTVSTMMISEYKIWSIQPSHQSVPQSAHSRLQKSLLYTTVHNS